jgi:hypothetical protein
MKELNLPTYAFKLTRTEDQTQIFDEVRRKWVVLTPEEWVRQHVLVYLRDNLGYPGGLLQVEGSLKLNGMKRRADVVAYDRTGKPFLLIECKAPEVALSQKVLDQAARYHLVLGVPYILITNGLEHFCIDTTNEGRPQYLHSIPVFPT